MTSQAGNNKGFTLLELVVVLLIIGIASSVVIVSLSIGQRKARIKYEARKLFTALKNARETAVARRSEIFFEPYEDNTGYLIMSKEKTLYDRSLPDGLMIDAEKIFFYPMGNSTGGVILLKDEHNREYEIVVSNITGKTKIRRVQPS